MHCSKQIFGVPSGKYLIEARTTLVSERLEEKHLHTNDLFGIGVDRQRKRTTMENNTCILIGRLWVVALHFTMKGLGMYLWFRP